MITFKCKICNTEVFPTSTGGFWCSTCNQFVDFYCYELNKEETQKELERSNKSKPSPPLVRIIQEGEIHICDKCHSSIKTNWYGKKLGCIQPKCSNYYKRGKNGI